MSTPSDIRSASDLTALPVLARQQVQQVSEAWLRTTGRRSDSISQRPAVPTGTPLRFYGPREDQFDHGFARSIRALEWAGLRLGDRTGAHRPAKTAWWRPSWDTPVCRPAAQRFLLCMWTRFQTRRCQA